MPDAIAVLNARQPVGHPLANQRGGHSGVGRGGMQADSSSLIDNALVSQVVKGPVVSATDAPVEIVEDTRVGRAVEVVSTSRKRKNLA